MSTERSPLLGAKVEVEVEGHHRVHYESNHLHDKREHHLHHHHHHHHSPRHYQPITQEGSARVEAGEGSGEDDILEEAEKTTDPYTVLGFAFSVLAGICFTSSNVMVKYLDDVSSWELLFIRCLIQMFAMCPLMACFHQNPLGPPDLPTRARVAAQGILGGILLFCIFQAVADLPLGDATAIFFSSPAFTMVLSTCILRDHCGIFRTLVAVTLLSGVVILSRPPSIFPPPADYTPPEHHHHNNKSNSSGHHHDPYVGVYSAPGLLAALAVPILSALIVIITRQAKHVHYSVLVFWFAVGGFIVSIIGIEFIDDHGGQIFRILYNWDSNQWVLTFLIAMVGLIGSILMTKAVCWVTPSKVMVVRSFEVVVAYILQVTVFDTPTHVSDVFGTLMVIVAVLSMGLEDPLMRRCRWRFL